MLRQPSLALPMAVVLLAGCQDADLPSWSSKVPEAALPSATASDHLVVYTQNLYVGTDVDAVLASPPAEVQQRVMAALGTFVATDWSSRARRIAAEIAQRRPDVIGLNEVTTLDVQGLAPLFPDLSVSFLPVLLAELSARGIQYDVAGTVDNIDVGLSLGGPSIRLRDADVMLVRRGLSVSNVTSGNYLARVTVPLGPLGSVDLVRGYVIADVTSRDRTVRVAVSHLEPKSTAPALQLAQAQELAAILSTATGPVIIAGDLNSDPRDPDPVTPYTLLREAGYQDTWLLDPGRRSLGFTCCHAPELRDDGRGFDERIDLVLVRDGSPANPIGPVHAELFGVTQRDRTEANLWPSDHAGLFTRLSWQGLLR